MSQEAIANAAPTPTKELTVIEKTLQENNLTEKILSELEAESKTIVIKGVDDKEGYKKADTFRKRAKEIKVLAKKICEKGREEANRIASEWIEAEKKVKGRAEKVEKETEAKIDAITAEIERLAAEKEKSEQERIQKRTKAFIDHGCTYDGINYTIAAISVSDAQIKTMADDIFETIIANVKVEHQKEIQAKAEAERIKKEEEEKAENLRKETERIRLENEHRAVELQKQADELKAREEAIKRKEQQEIVNSRIAKCQQLGLKWSANDESYVLHDVNVALIDIKTMEADAWDDLIVKLQDEIPVKIKEYNDWQDKLAKEKEEARLKEIEEAKIEAIRKLRYDMLRAVDYIYDFNDLGTMSDASWATLFDTISNSYQQKKQQELADKLKKEQEEMAAEALRQAALATDKDKLSLLSEAIGKIFLPEVQSQEAKVIVLEAKTMISKMQEHIIKKIKNL